MSETNMRDLGDFTDNELTIRDGKSGGVCTLLYRDIESDDIVKYRSLSYKKKEGKVKVNITKAQIIMALDIITGFKDGFFCINGNAISSDSQNPNFYKEWKNLLKRKAPDLLVVFTTAIFEGNSVKGNSADFEAEFVEKEGDDLLIEEEISGDGSGLALEGIEESPLESSSGE